MEKTKVPRGKEYYFVNNLFEAMSDYECDTDVDNIRFDTDNYFHTEAEAEQMARKIRAVLKGAEVIEIPSEEEIETYKKTLNHPHIPGCDYMERVVTDTANYSHLQGFQLGISWLKSKIVK